MTRTGLLLMILSLFACGKQDGGRSAEQTARQLQSGDKGSIGDGRFDEGLPEKALIPGLGFSSVEAPGLPLAVRGAADSVFELRVLGAGFEDALVELDLSGGKVAEWKARAEGMKDPLDRTVLLKQIENCQSRPEADKRCVLSTDIRKASGFLAGDQGLLWTNFHVVDPALEYREALAGLSKAEQLARGERVAVYVFDRKGRLALDPDKVPVQLAAFPKLGAGGPQPEERLYGEDSDYVGLRLGVRIGAPLRLAGRGLVESEPVYLLGYAGCTGCSSEAEAGSDALDFADRSPGQNSNGIGLKVSLGAGLSARAAELAFGDEGVFASRWNLQRMFFSSNDSQRGESGGPLLNAEGEVLAIHAAGKSFESEGKFRRISNSVAPDEFFPKKNPMN